MRITHAVPGRVDFELDIAQQHTVSLAYSSRRHRLMLTSQNRLKILHGGTIASMVDLGGSLAVASHGVFATGVSTDLNGAANVYLPVCLVNQFY